MNYRLSVAVLIICLVGCNPADKQYYYVENGKEESLKAPSDSAAYKKAFEQYQISLKEYHTKKLQLHNRYSAPRPHFILLDADKQNITYEVDFATKADYEAKTEVKYQQVKQPREDLKELPKQE